MIENTAVPPTCIVRRLTPQDKWTLLNLMVLGASKNGSSLVVNIFYFFYLLISTAISFGLAELLSGLNNKVLLIFYIILFDTIMAFFGKKYLDNFTFGTKSDRSPCWLIEYDGLVVGYGLVSVHQNYSMLDGLYILPNFRSQGLGSFLVRRIIQENIKPICLVCTTNLIGFYNRLGFVSASRRQIQRNFGSRIFQATHTLVLSRSINSTINSTYTVNTTQTLPPKRIIRRATKSDRAKIIQFIFTSSAIDVFLPFGITTSLVNSVTLLVLCLLPTSLILASLLILIGSQISFIKGLITVSTLIILLLPLGLFIFAYFQMQKWTQVHYIVEFNNKIIAYTRLSKHKQCYILHQPQFYSQLNLHRQQLISEILQYLVRLGNKPIYLACEAELVNIYKRLDFVTIATSNLPSALQFGANLNQKFGGTNLVLW